MPDINSLPPSGRSSSSQATNQPSTQQHSHNNSPTHIQRRPSATNSPRSPRLSSSFSRRNHGSFSLPPTGEMIGGIPFTPSSAVPFAPSGPSSRRGSSSRNSPSLQASHYADPHHTRTPSLGELHQELEEEQEAHVNRLLAQIRRQQAQIAEITAEPRTSSSRERDASAVGGTGGTGGDDQSPLGTSMYRQSSSRSSSRQPQSATTPFPPMRPAEMSRQSSHRSGSRGGSPMPGAMGAFGHGHGYGFPSFAPEEGRDEVALMQAESAMVMRENQMLKGRIRELERAVAEARREATLAQGARESAGDDGGGQQT